MSANDQQQNQSSKYFLILCTFPLPRDAGTRPHDDDGLSKTPRVLEAPCHKDVKPLSQTTQADEADSNTATTHHE